MSQSPSRQPCQSVSLFFSDLVGFVCVIALFLSLTFSSTVLLICADRRRCLKAVLSSVYGSPEMSNTAQLDFFFFFSFAILKANLIVLSFSSAQLFSVAQQLNALLCHFLFLACLL